MGSLLAGSHQGPPDPERQAEALSGRGNICVIFGGLTPQDAAAPRGEKQWAEGAGSGSDRTSGCTRPPTQACTGSRAFVFKGSREHGDARPTQPEGSSSQLLPASHADRFQMLQGRDLRLQGGGPSLTPAALAGRGEDTAWEDWWCFPQRVWT